MIQRQTWLNITDNTTVKWLQIFHLYKGFWRKSSFPGQFVKGSARVVSPPHLEYKGFKFKFNIKGDICRSLLIRSVFSSTNYDGSLIFFPSNNGVLIRRQQTIKSKYLIGPILKKLRRKKIQLLFKTIL